MPIFILIFWRMYGVVHSSALALWTPDGSECIALRGTGTRGCAIFSQKYISVHNSFMLALIDLVMVSKESSFKELSNGMHFN